MNESVLVSQCLVKHVSDFTMGVTHDYFLMVLLGRKYTHLKISQSHRTIEF